MPDPAARDRYLAFRAAQPRPPRLRAPHGARPRPRLRRLDLAGVPGAPPLCCVNGGLLFDHKVLWPSLAPLAAGRQLVFYDQRGRGASAPPPGARAARIEHDAGDLAALGAALRPLLGHTQWDVLGHSWGGGIAMLAAAEDAAGDDPVVRRLVLVDAVGLTGDWLPALHARALARLAGRGNASAHAALAAVDPAALAEPDPVRHAEYARAFYPAWFASDAVAALFTPPRAASVTGTAVAARLRRDGYDWRARWRGVHPPTLVLHGAEDVLDASVARDTAAWLARLAPVRLALLPGGGHMPFWEAAPEFFAAVESFLVRPILDP
jgi:proline iminopeptidase